LEQILFVDLFCELADDGLVYNVAVAAVSTEEQDLKTTHGSVLLVTAMGVFLKDEMPLVSSAMRRVESSRSLATFVASFPVSFWMFYTASKQAESGESGLRTLICALISVRSFSRCCTMELSIVRPRFACWSAIARVLSRMS
jgi:hypothetical protein